MTWDQEGKIFERLFCWVFFFAFFNGLICNRLKAIYQLHGAWFSDKDKCARTTLDCTKYLITKKHIKERGLSCAITLRGHNLHNRKRKEGTGREEIRKSVRTCHWTWIQTIDRATQSKAKGEEVLLSPALGEKDTLHSGELNAWTGSCHFSGRSHQLYSH